MSNAIPLCPKSARGVTARLFRFAAVCVSVISFFHANAFAQNAPSAASPGWQFSVSPYLWLAGVKGTVGVKGRTAPIDESFSDVLDQLDFGGMFLFEARRAPWSFFSDLMYVNLSDEQTVIDTISVDAHSKLTQFMFNPAVGYNVHQGYWGTLEVTGGLRYWYTNVDIDLLASGTSLASESGSRSWVDVVVGARIRGHFTEKWRYYWGGDLGGGGSRFTWQVISNIGYDFGRSFTLQGGYRVLDTDYRHDGVVNDTRMHGPYLGGSIRF